MKAHIDTITDLLLGSAYADKRLEGGEIAAIEGMLCKLLAVDALPQAQKDRIAGFNPAKFDATAAAGRLRFESAENKRTVLELIASVSESDDEIDMAEDAYLRKVAAGMGISDADIADLAIEVLEDDELDGILKP
ncbi:MAG: TerB family tellurite resistance protein [Deltaproteobacteria bacterium]|nr:TerB family tellurite resistance protein [Deltaproteobacteria bacterium]MBK8718039.1 TerB family tellurite resistance protein [Deltaproteobacteria bacterium]MBP7290790.1 TerB family tellurite resistance protein [Nannocystaceae bacterium]